MSSTNIFAALSDVNKKKKKGGKQGGEEVAAEPRVDKHAELEKAVFNAGGPGLSNWADDSEEEDEWGRSAPAAAVDGEGWSEVRGGWGPAPPSPNTRAVPCMRPATPAPANARPPPPQARGGYAAPQQRFDATPEAESEAESEEEVR